MFVWQATVQNEHGEAQLLPSVSVFKEDGTTYATIYKKDGSPLANPFVGGADGFVQFAADVGNYHVRASGASGVTNDWVITLGAPELAVLDNSSSPQVVVPVVLYVDMTGTDVDSANVDNIDHGLTRATAFRTWEAALAHAKYRHRFVGRLSTVELRFGAGNWGNFSLGSNLVQAEDYYPFAIHITHSDPANWPRFVGVSNSGFHPTYVFVKQVEVGSIGVVRRNTVSVQDIRIWNRGGVTYALYANVGGNLYCFGDIEIIEPVTYASAFVYAQQQGMVSLENGDNPTIFPGVTIIGANNITSPYKYRIVAGARVWISTNVYPQLTYAAKFWRDNLSISPQDNVDNAFKLRAANSGTTGYDYDPVTGELRQWGTITLTGMAPGRTNAAGTITFPNAFTGSYRFTNMSTNNVAVLASRESGSTATSCPVSAWNLAATAQNATVYWEAVGYP